MSDAPIRAWALDDTSRGLADGALARLVDVDEQKVRAALQRLHRLLPDDTGAPGWRMDEVTLSLEISAESGLVVAAAGARAGISVTFRRADAAR